MTEATESNNGSLPMESTEERKRGRSDSEEGVEGEGESDGEGGWKVAGAASNRNKNRKKKYTNLKSLATSQLSQPVTKDELAASITATNTVASQSVRNRRNKSQDKTDSSAATEEYSEACVFCGLCTGKAGIQCEMCDQFHHLECCGVEPEMAEGVSKFVTFMGWSCRACRMDYLRDFKRMKADIDSLKSELKSRSIRSDSTNLASVTNATPAESSADPEHLQTASRYNTNVNISDQPAVQLSEVVQVVRKSITDASRRKRNVIVTGLAEDGDGTDDGNYLSELCEHELYMNIRTKLKSVKRIGKIIPEKPRRLLATFYTESVAEDLLSRARDLRQSSDRYVAKNIFINKDLTPEAARDEYERREARRRDNKARRTTVTNDVGETVRDISTVVMDVDFDDAGASRAPIMSRPWDNNQMIFRNSGRSNHSRVMHEARSNLILCTPSNITSASSTSSSTDVGLHCSLNAGNASNSITCGDELNPTAMEFHPTVAAVVSKDTTTAAAQSVTNSA